MRKEREITKKFRDKVGNLIEGKGVDKRVKMELE